MVKDTKKMARMGLFPIGAIYSIRKAFLKDAKSIDNKLIQSLFLPCNYAFGSLLLFGAIALSMPRPWSFLQKMHGSLFALSSLWIMLSRATKSILAPRIAVFAQHYMSGYFLCGSVFSWENLPLLSLISKEISPNTHWDFKLGYLVLNIAIYSQTYALFLFNRQLNFPISDFGYFGCMSFFYVAGTFIGRSVEKKQWTKKATISFALMAAAVYSTFFFLRVYTSAYNSVPLICLIFSIYTVCISPVFPFYDVLVMHHLRKEYREMEKYERKEIFTRIRMWASIGHAIAGIAILYIYTVLNGKKESEEERAGSALFFFVLIGVMAVGLGVFVAIVHFSLQEKTEPQESSQKTLQKKAGSAEKSVKPQQNLLKNGDFLFLLFVIVSIGTTRGISSNYLVTYLAMEFNLHFSKVTYVMCIRTISEMAILYYSKHLLKYLGYHWLLLGSLLAATLRDFNYAFLPRTYTIVFATLGEVLKGVSSSCIVFSAVNIMDEIADANNKAQAQTMYSACYNGVSILLSSLLSLAIIRYFSDLRALFHASSSIGLLCCCVIIVKYGLIQGKLTLKKAAHK
ncbi:uncharacterized protein NEMAJ01_2241 [Nematocida major]|uniref:uncharacterized protein n=1 Tax=Nematocida major TaxID=1912982 RepID=UPI0020087348|nr:uncharacterized protein NEMAJ01_2223 [Nematocida major]XP_047772036.1 uncharacterized protein NEMAJ01_2241 [Nematocida major]KAH9387327.1 hypothetical protein NEMAJ01_2223 [Nematocida major]KAH9387345.1 hypothetical protein NEMAJ01_2241 [Nematocida major]